VGLTITISKNLFPQAGSLLEQAVADVFQREGGAIVAAMQSATPVDTGLLRGSESYQVSGKTLTFTASTSYALFVEAGTRYMSPRSYMVPAFNDGVPRILDAIASAINSGLGS
jgi:HK97 gp10 family phage protein